MWYNHGWTRIACLDQTRPGASRTATIARPLPVPFPPESPACLKQLSLNCWFLLESLSPSPIPIASAAAVSAPLWIEDGADARKAGEGRVPLPPSPIPMGEG